MQAFRIVGDSRSRSARSSSITSLILIGQTFSLWCALIHDEPMADDAIAAASPRRAPGWRATWPATAWSVDGLHLVSARCRQHS